jgi:N-acetylglucosamine malate deacetylase 1
MSNGNYMNILVVAPHADDETIGMGGTIARFAQQGNDVTVAVLTGHGKDQPHPLWPAETWDTVRSECTEACRMLGASKIIFEEVPAVCVADEPVWRLNKVTHSIVERVQPEMLFIPFLNDLHPDHRQCFHSFSVAWRPYLPLGKRIREVYTYETLSETHLNFPYVEQGFSPNTWVDISAFVETKIGAMECYRSQIQPHPSARSLEAAKALAVWRGSQIGVPAAEAFVLVRRTI